MTLDSRPKFFFWTLLAVVGAICLTSRQGFSLLFYPWFYPDSFDWLANALAYSTRVLEPYSISHRGLLPVLGMAVGYRFGVEQWFVYLGLACHLATAIAIYCWHKDWGSSFAALGSLLLANALAQSAYLGADLLANFFLVASALSWFSYWETSQRKHLLRAAILGALGAHSQYIAVAILPALGLSVRPNVLKKNWRDFLSATAVFLLLLCGLVIPRWINYQIVYQEGVQHLSLIRPFYAGGFNYYLQGLLAVFPISILLLAALGFFSGMRGDNSRRLTLFLSLWLLGVFSFFALLYSWTDIRFLIYLSAPLMLLAGMGFSAFATLLQRPRISAGLAIAVLLACNFTQTTDPFDPDRAGFSTTARPYLWMHWKEANALRPQYQALDIETYYASRPLLKLFSRLKLRLEHEAPSAAVLFFQPISNDEWYYVKNRNLLYLESKVLTFREAPAFRAALQQQPTAWVVSRSELLKDISYPLPPALDTEAGWVLYRAETLLDSSRASALQGGDGSRRQE